MLRNCITLSQERTFKNSLKWIKADNNENKSVCEAAVASAGLVLADGAGTDVLTIDPSSVTTGDTTACDDDRNDVTALKAIINKVATDNPAIFGVPSPNDGTKTGSQRAAEMMDTFVAALDNWDGADTQQENTQLLEIDAQHADRATGNEFEDFFTIQKLTFP